MSVLDYSKWDNIDTDSESDPEEEIEEIGAVNVEEENFDVQMSSFGSVFEENASDLLALTQDVRQPCIYEWRQKFIEGGFEDSFEEESESYWSKDCEENILFHSMHLPMRDMMMGMKMKFFLNNFAFRDMVEKQCQEKADAYLEILRAKRDNFKKKLRKRDYILKIKLLCVLPEIVRTVRVPAPVSLRVLQDKIISPAMGWKRNYHGYVFADPKCDEYEIGFGPVDCSAVDMMHRSQGISMIRGCDAMIDDRDVYLFDIIRNPGDQLLYLYDLGDRFIHSISLLEVIKRDKKTPVVEIIDGTGACPPEDSDGNHRFAQQWAELRSASVSQSRKILASFVQACNYEGKPFEFNLKKTQKRLIKNYRKNLSKANSDNMFTCSFGMSGTNKDLKRMGFGLPGPGELSRICDFCRKKQQKMQLCSRCCHVCYCSKECQTQAWEEHKIYCI